jgi:ABC-type dipeptide/oligopeptide/nickel transport system ATPase component
VQLARLVVDLVEELQIPALQVTHNHGEAAAMGRRILKMSKGRIVEEGNVAQILGAAKHFDDIGRTPMPELIKRD